MRVIKDVYNILYIYIYECIPKSYTRYLFKFSIALFAIIIKYIYEL